MGRVCAAYGCSNSEKDKGKGISLYMFPKDPTLRQKWVFAMKRKGFQPANHSSVCSAHFKSEDFEVEDKGRKDRKRGRIKKNVVPTIFTSGLPSHLQSGEKKRRVLQRINPTSNVKLQNPPACLAEGNPCCEREAWENKPIVSSMCRKCAISCGTNDGKKAKLSPDATSSCNKCNFTTKGKAGLQKHARDVHDQIRNSLVSQHTSRASMKSFRCDKCDYTTAGKTGLQRHVKAVHDLIKSGHVSHQKSSKPTKSFRCDKCDYATAGKAGLQRHVRQVHDRITRGLVSQITTRTASSGIEAESIDDIVPSETPGSFDSQCTSEKPISNLSTPLQAVTDKRLAYLQSFTPSDIDALLKRVQFLEERHKEDMKSRKSDRKIKKKLMKQVNYLQKKNAQMHDVILNMRKKELISKQAALVLSDRYSSVDLGLIKGLVKDRKKSQKYSKECRDFAVTLFYYSPRAYKYVSKFFSMPSVKTIRRWISVVDAYPGIY